MKVCKGCKIEKEVSRYYLKKDGKPRTSYCKECYCSKYKSEPSYKKRYYHENKEILIEKNRIYQQENKKRLMHYRKRYREENAECLKQKSKEFRENNKELVAERKINYWKNLSPEKKEKIRLKKKDMYHYNERYKEKKRCYVNSKLKNDEFFKLKFNIRALIRNSIKRGFTNKSIKTSEILGCSYQEFKVYLESKFDDKMNWENQGTYWHMDHIIPISTAKTEEDIYRLNHYTNFQPLFWLDNLKKSNRII